MKRQHARTFNVTCTYQASLHQKSRNILGGCVHFLLHVRYFGILSTLSLLACIQTIKNTYSSLFFLWSKAEDCIERFYTLIRKKCSLTNMLPAKRMCFCIHCAKTLSVVVFKHDNYKAFLKVSGA